MYSFYNKKRQAKDGATANITHADRQTYYNQTVDKAKWKLHLMVFGHNVLYNLLSFLNIGDEMIVIAQKQ